MNKQKAGKMVIPYYFTDRLLQDLPIVFWFIWGVFCETTSVWSPFFSYMKLSFSYFSYLVLVGKMRENFGALSSCGKFLVLGKMAYDKN